MKNKISQYPDLLKYQRKGIFVPFILTGVFCAVLIGIAVYLFANDLLIHHPVFYIILCLVIFLPIFVFKPYSYFLDKDYKGKVEKIEYKELISNDTQIPVSYINGIGNLQDERTNEHMDCWQRITIKTDNGKSIIFDAKPDVGKTHQNEGIPVGSFAVKKYTVSSLLDYYNKGDEVEHIKGFAFNRKLNLKPDEKNLCIVCGTLNIPKDDHCHNCGYSIIK